MGKSQNEGVDRYRVPGDKGGMMKLNQDQREGILQMISDLSKDATGARLRFDWTAMSDEELQKWWDYLNDTAVMSRALEAEHNATALVEYEAHLNTMVSDHGISKADAIRWDMQAEGITENHEQEFEHYLYKLGLGFGDWAPYKDLYDNSIKEAV